MAEDPRERPLNDVARKIMAQSNYDSHFSAIEERVIMETKLFLARADEYWGWGAPAASVPYREAPKILEGQTGGTSEVILPIPMILWCPSCGVQHIDGPERHKPGCSVLTRDAGPPYGTRFACTCDRWNNPPHRSHLCAYCKHVWRPADVPTTGVHEIASKLGSSDSQPVIRRTIDRTARFQPWWRHKARGTTYAELGRGELQFGVDAGRFFKEGDRLIAYRDDANRVWFRPETEFDDGRFEKITNAP